MKDFNYVKAENLQDALLQLSRLGEECIVLAGGTNVMVNIHLGKCRAGTLLDITGVSELSGIRFSDASVFIGATTTVHELSVTEELKKAAPALYMAACSFAEATTRRSATIGGNIGNASSGGDLLPPLLVLDAKVHLKSIGGSRVVRLEELFQRPGKLNKDPSELIVGVEFPREIRTGFVKLGPRNTMAISIATAAAYADTDENGLVRDCRIALGAVAPLPVRARHAEDAIRGSALNDDCLARMAEAVVQDINPRNPSVRASVEYRRSVVPELAWRALKIAASQE